MKQLRRLAHRIVAALLAGAVLFAQLALPPKAEAASLGSSTASAGSVPPPSVTAIQSFQPDLFTGRATTSIPIAVPPGRKGMQPSLALSYSSSGRNSWVGVGWGLDLGYIERSTKNGVPKYNSADTYAFMFQGVASDLVRIPDGTYRAKDEGLFLRFEDKGPPNGWEVRDKSGTRYLFGGSVDSEQGAAGNTFRWCLRKVVDTNGNFLTVSYTADQGQLYPARIDYTGHETNGLQDLAPSNYVTFATELRQDLDLSWRSGAAVTTARRLQEIAAYAPGQLARKYVFTYSQSQRTSRSLLATVTQVGADGVTALPATRFTYQDSSSPTYSMTANSATSNVIKPQMAGDADGNGITDVITFDASTATWSVAKSQPGGFQPSAVWLTGFGSTSTVPVLGDWNGDGLTDVGIFSSGNWQFATSTGSAFQTGAVSSFSGSSGTPIAGDFNGDGRIDIGTFDAAGSQGHWSIAIGSGASFAPMASFDRDLGGNNNFDPLTGDFNGDGLTDIGVTNKASGETIIALSDGQRFGQSTSWFGGFGGASVTSADFNGDGLTDIARYNRSTGLIECALSTGTSFGPASTLPVTFSLRSNDDSVQFGDFNGDGLADPAVFNPVTGAAEIARSAGTFVDLLSGIANGLGGSTAITYQPSTQCDNLCPVQRMPKLPFILPVVTNVTVSDGMGHDVASTYVFKHGRYDAPTREFRGFAEVDVRDADGNTATTQFLQDDAKKGRPFHSEFRDANGNLWTLQDQTWGAATPYPGVTFVTLDQTDSYVYDGDIRSRKTCSRFTYDAYGNITRADADGEAAVAGDERSTVTTYAAANTSAWILGKPSLTQTLDVNGTVVAQRRFYYDGASTTDAMPTVGSLTKEEEWLNSATPAWLATMLTYDAYGNVTTVTDALNRTTTNTYDASGTYLTRIANALGHTRAMTYDPRFGAVLTSTDQNSVTAATEYDALGRVIRVIGPNDTALLPTVSYAYDLSSVPATTTVQTRIQSGQPQVLTAYSFSDGLGRTVQTRTPAEQAGKQVVTGAVELNARGLAVKQWVSYASDFSSTYVPITREPLFSSLAFASYTYDPLGRALTTTGPDGAVTTMTRDDWLTTATDANGHQTRRTSDAFGRLAMVEEINDGQTYTTTYRYDTLNNLTQVTDARGNVTRIAYDSLGRKTSMDDPDMGHWSYQYDAVDNLTRQTDARGVVTAFTYDALNRVTNKAYTIPPSSGIADPGAVTYTYDGAATPYGKGKLSSITDGSGASAFEYDNLGRLTKETKTISGTAYTIQRAYDLLGRLTALTYPDNEVVGYTYNAQGGIETITGTPAGQSPVTYISNIDYNPAGQLTKIAYGNGVITDYSYNPQTLRLDHLTSAGPAGRLQDFTYAFDRVGNVTGITDAVHTGTQTFEYDPLNRLTRATGVYGDVRYAYDPIGNMLEKEGVQMAYGQGAGPHAVTSSSAGWQMQYDVNGNMVQKSAEADPARSALLTQHLSYDAENRLAKVDTAQQETVDVTLQPGWNFFSLPLIPDDARVTAVLPTFGQDFDQVSRWDAASNSYQHFVGQAAFDDFSQFEYGVGYQVYCKAAAAVKVSIKGKFPTRQFQKVLGVGWHLLPAITHTTAPVATILAGITRSQTLGLVNGSLAAATTAEKGQAYFVQVTTASTWTPPLPENVTTQFVYDGDGGRVKQTTASGTTTYLGESYEKDPAGKTTKYVFAGSMRLAAKSSDGELLFYHTDHLGSSDVITNATGQVVEHTEHLPYGAISRHDGPKDLPHKFTGQRQDAGTGLILFPARAYDPQLGRFIQADPTVQDPGDPQVLNRYSYVRNNPINLVDPSGYGWFKKLLAAVAIITAVVATVATAGAAIPATAPAIAAIAGEAFLTHAAAIAIGSTIVSAASAYASSTIGSSTAAPGILTQLTNSTPTFATSATPEFQPGANTPVIHLTDNFNYFGEGLFFLMGGDIARGIIGLGRAGYLRIAASEAGETVLEAGSRFSRFMLEAEAQAVEKSHLLRDGRAGETFFTTNKYRMVQSAESKLALPDSPEVRLDFKLKRDLRVTGPRTVTPKFGQPGGGTEFLTNEPVEVDIIRKRSLR